MPKKLTVTVTIGGGDAALLADAIKERAETLEKLGSNLMKQRQTDAAKPIYDQVSRLVAVGDSIRSQIGDTEQEE